MRKYNIASDLIQVKSIQPVVYKQYDNGDSLEVELFEDGEKITLTNEVILAFFELENGTVIQKDCTINENGNAVSVLDNNILSIGGKLKVEFTIYQDDKETTTRTILINVENSIDRNEAIETIPQWDIVQQVLDLKASDGTAIEEKINVLNQAVEDKYNELSAAAQVDSEVILARGGEVNLKARLDKTDAGLAEMSTKTLGYGTKLQRPLNPDVADLFFLTDKKRRIEYNGNAWQYLDGNPVDLLEVKNGNLYPTALLTPTSYTAGSFLANTVDMAKDLILYVKVKLADNNDFVHFSFLIDAAYQFQLTFGYNWTTSVKDGASISIYDYINASKTLLGNVDFYTTSHEIVVWYDHKWGYLNVYVDSVLIGSWKPSVGGANIAGVNKAQFDIGSGSTSVTFDYYYVATPLVTAIGDSITAGANTHAPNPTIYAGVDNYNSNYPKHISDYLKANGVKNYFVVNKGVNSDTTTGMLNRFTNDILNTGCKYVLIHGGINDYSSDNTALTIGNKKQMADTAISNSIQPLIIGVLPTYTSNVAHSYSISLHEAEMIGYKNYVYADVWESLEGATNNVADTTKIADTLHPNLEGYIDFANELKKYIAVE